MPCVVVGEVPRVRAVTDDEELDEAQERLGVSVTGVVLVVDDLLHRPPRADTERLKLHLNDGDAVDQEYDVVAVMAVVCIDAELIDDLEVVLAPVLDVDEGVVERRAVVADERFPVPEGACGFVHVGGDDLIEESLELAVGECDTIQGLELFLEVCFKRCSIADVGSIFILEVLKLRDKRLFKIAFGCDHRHRGTHYLFGSAKCGQSAWREMRTRAEAVFAAADVADNTVC